MMLSRAARFYSGVWLPIAGCWTIVVLVAAVFMERPDMAVGLFAAIGGPLVAVLFGALFSREQNSSSWRTVVASSGPREDELFMLGLKKGFTLGPISVLGVAMIPASILAADHILTALGK